MMDPIIYMPVYSSISPAFIIQLMIFSTDMVLLEEVLHQAGMALSNLILECNWKFHLSEDSLITGKIFYPITPDVNSLTNISNLCSLCLHIFVLGLFVKYTHN